MNSNVRFVNGTVRFVNGNVRFVNGTARYASCTVRLAKNKCTHCEQFARFDNDVGVE